MFHLIRYLLFCIPTALAWMAVVRHSPLLFLLLLLSHFLIVKFTSHCKGHESLWMLFLVSISFIPVNTYILILFFDLFQSFLPLSIIIGFLLYSILFSTEQIIMGVITRILWRRQIKIFL